MLMDSTTRTAPCIAIGAAVGVVAVLLVGAAVGGVVTTDAPPARSDATVDKDYFTSEKLLSAKDLWRLATETANGDAALEVETVSRHGRMIVLEAAVGTESLWTAHERLLGSLST